MTLRTFVGGVLPRDGKDLTSEKPIKFVLPGKELVYPLLQHDGSQAVPYVAVGDKVLTGQLIAGGDGFFSSCIYASVSGQVSVIGERRMADGEMIAAIVVENDGLYDEITYQTMPPPEEMTEAEIHERIRDAGIVGLGGSKIPTHVKLSLENPEQIAFLIINGIECEPYLTADLRILLEESERIISGINVLLRLFPYAHGIISITDDKEEAITKLMGLVEREAKINVRVLKTKYPQGSERQLVFSVTGRKLTGMMSPPDVGCLVLNVETILNISRAVIEGRNLMSRIITVSGDALCEPQNLSVRLGTSYQTLIDEAGGLIDEKDGSDGKKGKNREVKMIAGGPMRGEIIVAVDTPVTKETAGFLCLYKDEEADVEAACIKCRKCISVCPERLQPLRLATLAEKGDRKSFLAYDGMCCNGCGCCSYICPAKRHITQRIKAFMKGIT
ncbi:MAG: electron transport complex subunit RsxC [Lachnospiraceae bacterium]|jgi:electron transport complex protein RnfC|nr:electron transport complex subunit RsxC [Lachnospiraceae bacterium]